MRKQVNVNIKLFEQEMIAMEFLSELLKIYLGPASPSVELLSTITRRTKPNFF